MRIGRIGKSTIKTTKKNFYRSVKERKFIRILLNKYLSSMYKVKIFRDYNDFKMF